MAAHEQGKFWEMHDKLFANQQALDRADLEKYAQELGLDMGKFKAALDSGKFKARDRGGHRRRRQRGRRQRHPDLLHQRPRARAARSRFESFKAVIDEEIAKADELLKSRRARRAASSTRS